MKRNEEEVEVNEANEVGKGVYSRDEEMGKLEWCLARLIEEQTATFAALYIYVLTTNTEHTSDKSLSSPLFGAAMTSCVKSSFEQSWRSWMSRRRSRTG